MKRAICIILFMIFLGLVVGCATFGGVDVQGDEYIANRAQQRWKALIAGDFKEAYQFESPAYRKVKSLGYFKGGFGAWTRWTNAKVMSVNRESEQTAKVRIALEYEYFPGRSSVVEKDTSYFDEKWIYRKNEWWHVSN